MRRRREREIRRLATIVLGWGVLAVPLVAVSGCGKQLARIENNQTKLEAMVAANARDLATISDELYAGQGKINASIKTLDGDTRQVAAGVGAVQQQQQQLRQTVAAGHDGINRRLGSMAENERTLGTGVARISDVTQRTAADLADTRSSLQETLKVSREVLTAQMAASLQNEQTLQGDVRDLSDKADKLTANVADVATAQRATHEMVRANHEVVLTAMAGLSNGHDTLRTGLDKLDGKADRLADELASLATQQLSLADSMKANHNALVARLAHVSENQAGLQTSVGTLNGKADEMAAAQNTLGQALQSHSETVSSGLAGLAQGQQGLHAQLETLTAAAGQTARDVATLNNGQTAVHEAVQTAEKNLSVKADQTAAGLSNVAERQAALQQNIHTGQTALAAQATALANGQQALQNGIDHLGQATQRVASDLAVLGTGQQALQQTLKGHSDQVNAQVVQLAKTQEEMKAGLGALTATTAQGELDILALSNGQTGLAQAMKTGLADLGTRTDKLAAGQNALNDTVSRQGQTTAGQMARIADGQQQVQSSLNTLADHQKQMQSGLDTVTALTGQASLDALTLNNGQGQLGQAVQAGRQETAAKLTAMAQDQQTWSNRLDAAHARVATLSASITALEQQVAQLQGVVQAGLQGTTAALGTTHQQRQQFETKVSQDIQAVIEALAQLRQTQAALQEQIAQVQKSTQGQADNLRSVIEQMKGTPNATGGVWGPKPASNEAPRVREPAQAPAEVKLSAAVQKPQAPAATDSLPEAGE